MSNNAHAARARPDGHKTREGSPTPQVLHSFIQAAGARGLSDIAPRNTSKMATPSSTLPPTGMWDLLIRNVTRDASPLSSAELELLRQTRQELGPARWKQLLDVARTESNKRRREGHSLFLPTPGDKAWSPTALPPPRTNNIKPAFGSEDFKPPPRRTSPCPPAPPR